MIEIVVLASLFAAGWFFVDWRLDAHRPWTRDAELSLPLLETLSETLCPHCDGFRPLDSSACDGCGSRLIGAEFDQAAERQLTITPRSRFFSAPMSTVSRPDGIFIDNRKPQP